MEQPHERDHRGCAPAAPVAPRNQVYRHQVSLPSEKDRAHQGYADMVAFCHERVIAALADQPGLLWVRVEEHPTFGTVLVAEKCPPEAFVARALAAQKGA